MEDTARGVVRFAFRSIGLLGIDICKEGVKPSLFYSSGSGSVVKFYRTINIAN